MVSGAPGSCDDPFNLIRLLSQDLCEQDLRDILGYFWNSTTPPQIAAMLNNIRTGERESTVVPGIGYYVESFRAFASAELDQSVPTPLQQALAASLVLWLWRDVDVFRQDVVMWARRIAKTGLAPLASAIRFVQWVGTGKRGSDADIVLATAYILVEATIVAITHARNEAIPELVREHARAMSVRSRLRMVLGSDIAQPNDNHWDRLWRDRLALGNDTAQAIEELWKVLCAQRD